MDNVFEMATGPYIPKEHEAYGLLPRLQAHGGEVFSYPPELNEVEQALFEAEGIVDDGQRASLIIPYGMSSYAEYFALLDGYAQKHRATRPDLVGALERLAATIRRMNVKEDWSVVRYVGHEYDSDPLRFGLTRGRCYYWPCSKEQPIYEGVIDDEEFTSYWYPCNPASWEVVLDPTGMATRTLAGQASA